MTVITALTDLSKLPNQAQDQATFDANMAYLVENLPERARQENELVASLNTMAAGGAYALPFVFDSATADADPGIGKVRFGSASQNAATVLRFDNAAFGGADVSAIFAALLTGTSLIKGAVRLVKSTDPSKWMIFDITGSGGGSGYRNLNVVLRAASATNPFAINDLLLAYFDRVGDMPIGALELLGSATVSSAVAQIDFLNIFNSSCDKYQIEVHGLSAGGGPLRLRMAQGGVVQTSGYFGLVSPEVSVPAATDNFFLSSTVSGAGFTIEVSSANLASAKRVGARGSSLGSGQITSAEGYFNTSMPVSGFRLYLGSAGNFTSGTVRVYGLRHQ